MPIIEIFDPTEWPRAKSFLQSYEWGEFQKNVGNVPRRFLVNEKPVQIFVHHLPIGVFWYIPHSDLEASDYELLTEFAWKENKAIFIRVESLLPIELPNAGAMIKYRQPEHSLVLDLKKTEHDLLSEMHSKTRYNIRLAQKKGLIISWEKNAAIFNQLMCETAKRDKFSAHPFDYYKKMLDCSLIEHATVYFNDQVLASAIFIQCSETYTYLHGASSNNCREFMAPYLLQWSAIVRAKENGFAQYDFWGVAPQDAPADHSWSGITRFKIGFGGTRTQCGQAFEIPVRKLHYKLFSFFKFFLNIFNTILNT